MTKFTPLLIVLLLTALATGVAHLSPAARALRALALLLDVVPVAGVIVVTVMEIIRQRRLPLRLPRISIAVYGYFAGALIATLGVAHLVAVVIERGRRDPFVYSFHVYSLVLLGVLLIASGFMAAVTNAWRPSVFIWAAILAINVPLIPLQGFAVLFSVLAAIELLLLGGMRRHFAVYADDRPHP